MGQAKRRGTFEERKAQAIARRIEIIHNQRPVATIQDIGFAKPAPYRSRLSGVALLALMAATRR
jgi:hypothetical protein